MLLLRCAASISSSERDAPGVPPPSENGRTPRAADCATPPDSVRLPAGVVAWRGEPAVEVCTGEPKADDTEESPPALLMLTLTLLLLPPSREPNARRRKDSEPMPTKRPALRRASVRQRASASTSSSKPSSALACAVRDETSAANLVRRASDSRALVRTRLQPSSSARSSAVRRVAPTGGRGALKRDSAAKVMLCAAASSMTPSEPCFSRYSTSASVLCTLRQFLGPAAASGPSRRQMTWPPPRGRRRSQR